jgi:hypothetical protein
MTCCVIAVGTSVLIGSPGQVSIWDLNSRSVEVDSSLVGDTEHEQEIGYPSHDSQRSKMRLLGGLDKLCQK